VTAEGSDAADAAGREGDAISDVMLTYDGRRFDQLHLRPQTTGGLARRWNGELDNALDEVLRMATILLEHMCFAMPTDTMRPGWLDDGMWLGELCRLRHELYPWVQHLGRVRSCALEFYDALLQHTVQDACQALTPADPRWATATTIDTHWRAHVADDDTSAEEIFRAVHTLHALLPRHAHAEPWAVPDQPPPPAHTQGDVPEPVTARHGHPADNRHGRPAWLPYGWSEPPPHQKLARNDTHWGYPPPHPDESEEAQLYNDNGCGQPT
jgi:hypothetical protein